VLVLLIALAAVYAFGYRAAGRLGAIVSISVAIAAAPLRDAALAGTPLPVLVLAAALFGYALHACLAEATPFAITLLAAGVALLTLADPVWLPGALVSLAVVALVCAERARRVRVLGIGLLATALLLTPHLASTASQNDGSLFANMSARAIAARNAEFVGQGHGAPTPVQYADDPLSGEPVTIAEYLFGDHSISQVVGGVLDGAQESFAAWGESGSSGIAGAIAFALVILGGLYVLVLARLRLLVLLPSLVVAPSLFIVSRTEADPLAGGAALWTCLLVCAGILAYATEQLARPAVETRLPLRRSTRRTKRRGDAVPEPNAHSVPHHAPTLAGTGGRERTGELDR
jgi:hypothetical protein